MADFNLAEPFILEDEGGYANVPGDSGGETYEGISFNDNPDWPGIAIVHAHLPLARGAKINDVTLQQLVDTFYKANVWDECCADQINDQSVANYIADFYTTSKHNAAKCVQRVVGVTADGFIGSGTVAAINAYSGDLLADLHTERVRYYNAIGTGSDAQFLNGWLNRANNLYTKLAA